MSIHTTTTDSKVLDPSPPTRNPDVLPKGTLADCVQQDILADFEHRLGRVRLRRGWRPPACQPALAPLGTILAAAAAPILLDLRRRRHGAATTPPATRASTAAGPRGGGSSGALAPPPPGHPPQLTGRHPHRGDMYARTTRAPPWRCTARSSRHTARRGAPDRKCTPGRVGRAVGNGRGGAPRRRDQQRRAHTEQRGDDGGCRRPDRPRPAYRGPEGRHRPRLTRHTRRASEDAAHTVVPGYRAAAVGGGNLRAQRRGGMRSTCQGGDGACCHQLPPPLHLQATPKAQRERGHARHAGGYVRLDWSTTPQGVLTVSIQLIHAL